MARLETVRIVAEGKQGSAIINKSDFDPKIHKLFEESNTKVKQEPPAPVLPVVTKPLTKQEPPVATQSDPSVPAWMQPQPPQ
jgi:hypothetical protein